MKWISKEPPLYVWPDDTWFNEKGNLYYADCVNFYWESRHGKKIVMPEKTMIRYREGWYNVKKGWFISKAPLGASVSI